MRPSRQQMYLAMARAASMRGTCYRLNVGCIVVSGGNVVGIGYNGITKGLPHCGGNGCPYFTPAGCKVIHAEVNAIRRACESVGHEVPVQLYCTHSPCGECVDVILAGGLLNVTAVHYEAAYRDPSPMARLTAAGVEVFRVLPSGMMVDEATGELMSDR